MSAWVGMDEVMARLSAMTAQASAAAKVAAVGAASIVEAKAKANFEGSHSKGKPHVGGDKPNVVTGTARRSIVTDPVESVALGEFLTRVGPTVVYGRRLELGWPGSSGRSHQHTRAFPYFDPAVADTQPEVAEFAAQTWAKFMR